MPCVVGMTTDVEARQRRWRRQYPNLDWELIQCELTYDEALALERRTADNRGCRQESGGPRKPGRVWCVYVFYY